VEQWSGVLHMVSNERLVSLLWTSGLSDHHQGALFLAKVMLQYSQNSIGQDRNMSECFKMF